MSQLLGMYVLKSLVQTQTQQMIFAVFFAFSSSLLVVPKNFILLENLITIIASWLYKDRNNTRERAPDWKEHQIEIWILWPMASCAEKSNSPFLALSFLSYVVANNVYLIGQFQ